MTVGARVPLGFVVPGVVTDRAAMHGGRRAGASRRDVWRLMAIWNHLTPENAATGCTTHQERRCEMPMRC